MNRVSSSAALGIAALLALTCRGRAQDAADTQQSAAPRRYEIEIILFANTNADAHSELFSVEHAPETPGTTPLPLQPVPYGGDADTELQRVPGAPPAAAAQPLNGTTATGAPTAPPPSAAALNAAPQPDGPSAVPRAAALQAIPAAPQDAGAAGKAAAAAAPAGAAGAAADTAAPVQAFTFRLLKPSEMKLNAEYAKIARLDAYRPLGHAAWIQEGLPEDRARPIDMAELGIANPSGTIRLHVSRYPHISVDLTYRMQPQATDAAAAGGVQSPADAPAGPAAPPDAPSSPGRPAAEPANAAGLGPVPVAHRYIMHQERRVRAGELQYFDHPMFGLLLLITPAPKKAPKQPANGSGALTPAA